ncbi:ParA family protein [Aliarcobacter butzleri]|uniref:ParA family protein n=1 Tax=Aliarcobacter butzleri TaxID=28197 RepID=UPI002877058F|nr:ParA family protein [Aliarcobacter butzleri]MDS1370681.1 ParA family protein [Aliarcobacter butzleri]
MIITVAHTKGGVGKSTLAWNLAHSLKATGKTVRIVDLDFQQTLYFINALNEDSQIEVLQPETITELLDIFKNNKGYLIVDVGGFDSDINRTAMEKANKIVVPVSSSVTEVIGFQTFKDILKDIDAVSINVVLNNIHPLQKDFTDIEDVIQNENMKLLKTVVRSRKIYKDSLGFGKSVFDTTDKKAIEEIRGLKNELIN